MREVGCRRRAGRRGGWGGGGSDNGGGTQNKYTEGGREHASRGAPGRRRWAGILLAAGAHVLNLYNQFLFHDPCPGPEGCHPGALPLPIKDPL